MVNASDEDILLKALHEQSPAYPRSNAEFKIEVHWGKDRTIRGPNTGAILIWESAKRFHGGGDERMYWCGYRDCDKPIRAEFFSLFSVVCPHCNRESLLDVESKRQFLATKGASSDTLAMVERMPIVYGEKFFKSSTKKVVALIEKIWLDLGSNADVYMKYHKSDIRCQSVLDVSNPDIYDKARNARNSRVLIYPLYRIIKDISAGASVQSRFMAMCTA